MIKKLLKDCLKTNKKIKNHKFHDLKTATYLFLRSNSTEPVTEITETVESFSCTKKVLNSKKMLFIHDSVFCMSLLH